MPVIGIYGDRFMGTVYPFLAKLPTAHRSVIAKFVYCPSNSLLTGLVLRTGTLVQTNGTVHLASNLSHLASETNCGSKMPFDVTDHGTFL